MSKITSVTRENVSLPENYMDGDVEKTFWHNIGTLTHFHKEDGTVSTQLFIPAYNLKAQVFPQKSN
jgi:hypothetical protein